MRKQIVMITLILALTTCVFANKNMQSALCGEINPLKPTQDSSFASQNQSLTSENNNTRYTIWGKGNVEVLPDMAEVCIKIEYVDLVKENAQKCVSDLLESLKNTLANKGIVDIKTDNQYTYCQYKGEAYNSSMYVHFDLVDLQNIHNTLKGIENDYVTITGINYKVKDYEKWHCVAIQNAITNAQAKLQNITNQNTKIFSIEEEGCYYPVCVYREYDGSQFQNNENIPLEITASVRVVFETE